MKNKRTYETTARQSRKQKNHPLPPLPLEGEGESGGKKQNLEKLNISSTEGTEKKIRFNLLKEISPCALWLVFLFLRREK